ncbi:GcrA family cell cycle regulator [Sphingomicrobium sp. XHP0239]|uniref:GcrA family cell cycle regulator n=1 Tax=Sphingomicrobium maritimum TaxID=3133972 RepID=UPI0031CC7B95
MSWTDERIDRLKAMWAEGKTASQIAEDLGGVSRNAVIGKAHRLGLESRPSPVKAGEKKKAAPRKKAAAKKPAASKAAPKKAAPAVPKEAKKAVGTPDPDRAARPEPEKATGSGKPDDKKAPASGSGSGKPQYRSVGPGGFVRQGPSDQQAPIPPAPPRRLIPEKPSEEVADKTSLLDLNERICRWPMGHPGESDFHFCGEAANPGFPYCVDHCGVAYQAQLPRRDRKPPPPLPFGGPRVR